MTGPVLFISSGDPIPEGFDIDVLLPHAETEQRTWGQIQSALLQVLDVMRPHQELATTSFTLGRLFRELPPTAAGIFEWGLRKELRELLLGLWSAPHERAHGLVRAKAEDAIRLLTLPDEEKPPDSQFFTKDALPFDPKLERREKALTVFIDGTGADVDVLMTKLERAMHATVTEHMRAAAEKHDWRPEENGPLTTFTSPGGKKIRWMAMENPEE